MMNTVSITWNLACTMNTSSPFPPPPPTTNPPPATPCIPQMRTNRGVLIGLTILGLSSLQLSCTDNEDIICCCSSLEHINAYFSIIAFATNNEELWVRRKRQHLRDAVFFFCLMCDQSGLPWLSWTFAHLTRSLLSIYNQRVIMNA